MREALAFDDVLLVPGRSDIDSRSEVDISSDLDLGVSLNVPIFSAPMDTITEGAMGAALSDFGGCGIIHRYNSIEEQVRQVNIACQLSKVHSSYIKRNIGVAVGVSGDFLERSKESVRAGANLICIDVAHGHHTKVRTALRQIRLHVGDSVHIMAGNVATLEAFDDLSDWGADSIRVGIGGGSICSTRIQTGHGVPTFQSILDCSHSQRPAKLIADGGIKTSGDIVKALAAGADAVMCGSLLSGTRETPGRTIHDTDGRWKEYRGMASKEAQRDWKGSYNSLEGISTRVPFRGAVIDILEDLRRGITSGFSYSGARDLAQLQSRAKFIRQTSAGASESRTHILNRRW